MSGISTALCALDDLVDGTATRFEIGGRVISAVRLGDQVYVIGDRCSHADVSLSDGIVDEDECTLECPKHGSAFSLETGEALSLPALKPVPSYAVTITDGQVEVELS